MCHGRRRLVAGDVRRDGVLGEQRVEQLDHGRARRRRWRPRRPGAGPLTNRRSAPASRSATAALQPLALVEEVQQVLGVAEVGVHQPRRAAPRNEQSPSLDLTQPAKATGARAGSSGHPRYPTYRSDEVATFPHGQPGWIWWTGTVGSEGVDVHRGGGVGEGPTGVAPRHLRRAGALRRRCVVAAPAPAAGLDARRVLGNLPFLGAAALLVRRAASHPEQRSWTLPLALALHRLPVRQPGLHGAERPRGR